MPDISTLSGLAPVEMIDLDTYAINQPKSSFRLPERGIYTLQAPAAFPAEAFGVSKAGALTVQIDPTIVGGDNDGFQLRFIKVSAKTFKRDGVTVSQLGDYLKAVGITGAFASPQDLADAVELTAGATYQAELDWRAYKDGYALEGMQNFPKNEDGTYRSWVEHPTAKTVNDKGEEVPVRVFANLYIRNFIAA